MNTAVPHLQGHIFVWPDEDAGAGQLNQELGNIGHVHLGQWGSGWCLSQCPDGGKKALLYTLLMSPEWVEQKAQDTQEAKCTQGRQICRKDRLNN